jgi:hypothetical protein
MSESFSLRYPSYGCLYLINEKGELKVLYTPFRVLCIQETETIPKGTTVYVEAVCSYLPVYVLAYLVNGKILPHYYFIIQINF